MVRYTRTREGNVADIDLERKDKRSLWPWILGLLGLVLVVWFAAEMLGDDDADYAATEPAAEQVTPATSPQPEADADAPAAVAEFEEQCASRTTTTDEMSLDHEYEESCVRQMTAALDAVIQRETVDDTELAELMRDYRTRADRLTENRDSPEHSTYLRDVFDGVEGLIAHIEDTREEAGEALDRRSDDVAEAAAAFTADEPVLEQREEVAAFFRETAAALRAMHDRGRS